MLGGRLFHTLTMRSLKICRAFLHRIRDLWGQSSAEVLTYGDFDRGKPVSGGLVTVANDGGNLVVRTSTMQSAARRLDEAINLAQLTRPEKRSNGVVRAYERTGDRHPSNFLSGAAGMLCKVLWPLAIEGRGPSRDGTGSGFLTYDSTRPGGCGAPSGECLRRKGRHGVVCR